MSMSRYKISVIGAGQVGGTLAMRIAETWSSDVIIVDIVEGTAKGKALDIAQSCPIFDSESKISGTSNFDDISGSDIVIMTAGLPRKPGMSREQLLEANVKIVKQAAENIKKNCPDAIVIVVTNPLDAMTYTLWKVSGLPKNKVMGMAGVLDSSRFRTFLSMELNISSKDINAFVLGSHGDSMVPVLSYTTVGGVPVSDLLPKEKLETIIARTRNGGAEIVNLLQTGSAYYAPSSSVIYMMDSIIFDRKRVMPCSVMCKGEYGIKDVFIGVPVILGKNGVEKIVEFKITDDERRALEKSADIVASLQRQIDKML